VGDANLLAASAADGVARTSIGLVPLQHPDDGPVTVLLRPEALRLASGGDAMVELVEFYGHDTVYLVRTATGPRVRVRAGSAPQHRRGEHVTVSYAGGPALSFTGDRTAAEPETTPVSAPASTATATPA
jgi:hypothetical protein